MKNQIVVNLTTYRLYYFENNQLQKEYPIGIGQAATPTPPGVYQVLEKLAFRLTHNKRPETVAFLHLESEIA